MIRKISQIFFKVHKRRLKALELEPYSIQESEQAAGHGNFKAAKKRKISTILPEASKKIRLNEPTKAAITASESADDTITL